MLFSEVYSSYYNAVASLINKAIDGELDNTSAVEIIRETAFAESFVYLLPAMKSEQWQVITKDFKTPIKNKTCMPLTLLQKRFLKAISLDKRFRLFVDTIEGLDDIEPLYTCDDFHYFDIIKDGDPFESKEYISIFKTVLKGLKEKKRLSISFESGKGHLLQKIVTPQKIEYSQKDDKFRLKCCSRYEPLTINIARIRSCELLSDVHADYKDLSVREKNSLVLNIRDERNALERCMLHFSNFEKTTRQISNGQYQMALKYNKEDETELLIRILSFGPMIKVVEPQRFINLITERLDNQKKLRTD